jgi:hypothetical protein
MYQYSAQYKYNHDEVSVKQLSKSLADRGITTYIKTVAIESTTYKLSRRFSWQELVHRRITQLIHGPIIHLLVDISHEYLS